LPLIEIRALSDQRPIAAAWSLCHQCQAIMFVSAAAVDHFFSARPIDADLGTPQDGPRFWATGPGTVASLVRHGIAAHRIDAPAPDSGQFDSEALWGLAGGQVRPGWQVMLLRGADRDVGAQIASSAAGMDPPGTAARGQGRDWLAGQLANADAHVHYVVAYWRAAPQTQALQASLAAHGIGDDALWLFTSAQAIAHLRACLPAQDWSQARAITSHARIAAAAQAAGFGVVLESRPALADMAASIKSLG
jgi:uroporphyrinogen-III synthase